LWYDGICVGQIRLPFGRKKKHQESLPPPPSAVQDELTEPAFDDDVEVVKQLCGMGFGRSKVVSALEMHGYDVGKALNSLVGS
jgi:epidermal growth factor receptor substrate 15